MATHESVLLTKNGLTLQRSQGCRGVGNLLFVIAVLSDLDDDLAFCTSFFEVSQSLLCRFEWKDPIHDRAYDPGIDEDVISRNWSPFALMKRNE